MGKKIMLNGETQLWIKHIRGDVYRLSMLVYISEDINYTASDDVCVSDYDSDVIEEACYAIGVSPEDDPAKVAEAIFKLNAEQGEYSPY